MIDAALSFLSDELNEYLQIKSNDPDTQRIILSNVAISSEGGSGLGIPDNHLGMSLINIEEERVFKDQRTAFINADGITEHMNPELKLNIYVLISANYQDSVASGSSEDYKEGLKQLSYVISFFQAKNVFNKDNSPTLAEASIDKLVVELYSYSFEQLNNFWSVLGTHYLPSVLYKIRVITFQEQAIQETALPIEKINVNTGGK